MDSSVQYSSAQCFKQIWKVGKVGKVGKLGKVGKAGKVGKVGVPRMLLIRTERLKVAIP
jgi:hypothetical protein